MKTIYLHGYLKEKFGEKFVFDVESPSMALKGLFSQVKGFSEVIREGSFYIIRGEKGSRISLGVEDLSLKFGKSKELHIVPVVQGAGGNGRGILKIVVGVALLATGIGFGISAGFGAAAFGVTSAVSYGTIAAFGASLTLAGVAQMLTPRPDLGSYEDQGPADQRPSFLFNGPVNQSVQGAPVPLVYGRFRVGSIVVSRGLSTEKI